MAAIAATPADNDNDVDNIVTTVDMHYIIMFVLDKCIVYVFECIVCRLLAPVVEDDDDIDDDDNEEKMEEIEEEL